MSEKKLATSELQLRATAALNEEVKRELEIPDPSSEKATAILKGDKSGK